MVCVSASTGRPAIVSLPGMIFSAARFGFMVNGRVIAALLLLWASTAAAALSPEERRIVDWATAQQEPMIALLEQAVKIDSPSENLAGVRAMYDLFAGELQALGFTPRWVPLAAESRRAGHLFAERAGRKGKRVLLIGHLDTVLPGGTFTRDGDTGRGSGTADMKGGDVVLIFALKALHAAGALEDTQIVVAMTGDEESIGGSVEASRQALIEAGKRSDVALSFEGGKQGEGTVARRGASSWSIEVTGPTGHSSGIFNAALGSGAVYEAGRIIEGFHTELRKLPGLTANVALIAGGAEVQDTPFTLTATGKNNIIPPVVVMRGDLRAVSPEQLAQAEKAMRDVVAKNRPRTQTKLSFSHRYPPMAAEPRHLEVLALFDAVSRDLGHGPQVANDPAQRGAGDAAFVAPYVATLDGLGPYGAGSHAPRESLNLKSLPPQVARAAVMIYRLTR
jgi:glutamate carboxypeptidase